MILKMFSIRDTKAAKYFNPFYKEMQGEAERDFQTAVNDPKTGNLYEYPEDYDLFYVGDFDIMTGKVVPLDTPRHIVKAVNLKKQIN